MQLTKRDRALFRSLLFYGVLRTSQIAKLLFQNCSRSALLRRLAILEKGSFIKRASSHHLEAIWLLTHKGARVLGERKSTKIHINENQLSHDLLLAELILTLKNNSIGESFELEHNLRSKILRKSAFQKRENILLPDALFIIEKDQKEVVALELELHKKAPSRYKKIFRKYQEKKNLFALWYIVKTLNLGFYLENLWRNTTWRANPIPFMFSLLEDVQKDPKEAIVYAKGEKYLLPNVF